MMFNDNERFDIENLKREIQGQIRSRDLLSPGLLQNIVIAGGFFTSVLQNRKFKDIDIFILNNDVQIYNLLVRGYHQQQVAVANAPAKTADYLNATLDSIFDPPTAATEWSRSEIMSYMHNPNILDVINNHRTEAQYILTKYKTREELLAHFDYAHCKVSYVPTEDKLYINRETYDCIKNKILKINNEEQSKNHQYRLTNFLNKGWTLDEIAKEKLADRQREAIQESFEKLKMEAFVSAAKIAEKVQPGTYTIGEDALKSLGLTAQDLDPYLQTK